jgi:hypothetical protein
MSDISVLTCQQINHRNQLYTAVILKNGMTTGTTSFSVHSRHWQLFYPEQTIFFVVSHHPVQENNRKSKGKQQIYVHP